MFNPKIIFELQNKWTQFTNRHPKFPMFLRAIGNAELKPGTIIEVKYITSNGQEISSNVKLGEEDVEMLKDVASMMKGMR